MQNHRASIPRKCPANNKKLTRSEKDELIKAAYNEYMRPGVIHPNWEMIARIYNKKNPNDTLTENKILNRWCDHLNPALRTDKITGDEAEYIIRQYLQQATNCLNAEPNESKRINWIEISNELFREMGILRSHNVIKSFVHSREKARERQLDPYEAMRKSSVDANTARLDIVIQRLLDGEYDYTDSYKTAGLFSIRVNHFEQDNARPSPKSRV